MVCTRYFHISPKTKRLSNGRYSIIITGLVKVILGYPKNSRVPSYSNTEIWTTVHAGMSIVCASLPIFRPLLKAFRSFIMSKLLYIKSIGARTTSQSSREPPSHMRGIASVSGGAVGRELQNTLENKFHLPTILVADEDEQSLSF